jgi:hypothetical protein
MPWLCTMHPFIHHSTSPFHFLSKPCSLLSSCQYLHTKTIYSWFWSRNKYTYTLRHGHAYLEQHTHYRPVSCRYKIRSWICASQRDHRQCMCVYCIRKDMHLCVCVCASMWVCVTSWIHRSESITAILILIEGQLQVFQRFSSSKLVLKTVKSCFVALNYCENDGSSQE